MPDRDWIVTRELGTGGQGSARLVHKKGEPEHLYVLKKLNKQRIPERRARFCREVVSLELLVGHVPYLVEHNSEFYKDLPVDLYLVCDYIEGPTLEEYLLKHGPTDLYGATLLVRQLLSTLEFAHAKGVLHRDIKPDNIVLRNEALDEPVLIDFGLSFNKDANSSSLATASEQELGNRFIVLPELKIAETKSDPRSDISAAIGILYYCITGRQPKVLLDHEGNPPHRRPEAMNVLSSLPSAIRSRLNTIFERGFTSNLSARFSTVLEARTQIDQLTTEEMSPPKTFVGASRLIEEAMPHIGPYKDDAKILSSFWDAINQGISAVIQKDPGQWSTVNQGTEIQYETRSATALCGIQHPYSQLQIMPRFDCQIAEGMVRVDASYAGETERLFDKPLDMFVDWVELRAVLEEYFLRQLDRMLKGRKLLT